VASEESRAGVELSDECAGNETSKRIASLALAIAQDPLARGTHHTQVDDPLPVAFDPADFRVELRSVSKEGVTYLLCYAMGNDVDAVPCFWTRVGGSVQDSELEMGSGRVVSPLDLFLEAPEVGRGAIEAMEEETEMNVCRHCRGDNSEEDQLCLEEGSVKCRSSRVRGR
jgi:hypothetical protein